MTHVCAWCGRGFIGTSILYHDHIICPECAIEEAYNQGWNDALAEVRRRVGGLGKEGGGAPRIPMKTHEVNGIWYEDGDAREDT